MEGPQSSPSTSSKQKSLHCSIQREVKEFRTERFGHRGWRQIKYTEKRDACFTFRNRNRHKLQLERAEEGRPHPRYCYWLFCTVNVRKLETLHLGIAKLYL